VLYFYTLTTFSWYLFCTLYYSEMGHCAEWVLLLFVLWIHFCTFTKVTFCNHDHLLVFENLKTKVFVRKGSDYFFQHCHCLGRGVHVKVCASTSVFWPVCPRRGEPHRTSSRSCSEHCSWSPQHPESGRKPRRSLPVTHTQTHTELIIRTSLCKWSSSG